MLRGRSKIKAGIWEKELVTRSVQQWEFPRGKLVENVRGESSGRAQGNCEGLYCEGRRVTATGFLWDDRAFLSGRNRH